MTDMLYRSFAPELEVHAGGDGRTIEGIAVPYGRPQRIDARLTEQFRSGAFKHQFKAAHRVKFSREHIVLGGTLIGRAIELRDDAAGLFGRWRVSATPVGDETLELVRDGALEELSVGYRERQNKRLPDGTIERVSADLFEVAVVMEGAFGQSAMVSAVRSAGAGGCSCGGCTCGSGPSNMDKARQVLAQIPVLRP